MNRTLLGLLAIAGLASCAKQEAPAQTVACAETSAAGIQVTDAWVRPAAEGQQVTAAYFTLCNASDTADKLVSVETTIASTVELHETTKDSSGVASMAPVEGVGILPHAAVALEPGGKHVMLIGVTQPLIEGATATLTLKFENSPALTIEVPVRAQGESHDAH
jgi:copper(I)-binding protein